ncbi:MAG TPA: IPT/TIG domain-containing protein, partial [Bryobacteraceae bacterium]|nr:IPT/TIG domain-containing protein [Bryobacteraceae bacterium]
MSFLLLACASLSAADFRLRIHYAEWGPAISPGEQLAADSLGMLYILDIPASSLTKLAADGKTVLWQQNLASRVSTMAVDPNGGIYLISDPAGSSAIEKLSADGSAVLWKTQIAGAISLAVDATGRAFVVANSQVIRLNASGAIDATFANAPVGPLASLAVSPDGSDIVIGTYLALSGPDPVYTLERLATDQTTWLTNRLPLAPFYPGLAVAANGDAVVYGSDANGRRSLQRLDRTGKVVFSTSVLSSGQAPGNLALDAAGNAYITGYTGAFAIPTKNTLASCGSTWLGVYAPDGTILQTTFLPGATSTPEGYPLIAVGNGGAAFVLSQVDATFTPTQTGPLPQSANALFSLSPNADAKVLPLGCVANAYSFNTGAVAPGEMVALYGNGLGPAQGVQPSGYPAQAAGVQVTFDGMPAPLQWVQDSQINAAVPFSVAGPVTKICVTYNGGTPNCLTWPVTSAAPGVLTWDGTNAVAVNQDGTLNSASNPAAQDSLVAVFATGLGRTNAPLADGSLVPISPLPVNTWPVTIGVPFNIGFVPAMSYLAANYAGP